MYFTVGSVALGSTDQVQGDYHGVCPFLVDTFISVSKPELIPFETWYYKEVNVVKYDIYMFLLFIKWAQENKLRSRYLQWPGESHPWPLMPIHSGQLCLILCSGYF